MKIGRLPSNDSTNGWSRILPPRQPKPPLRGDARADWIVLGAGFAGLAAARRLAENRPAETVALIEAGMAGENASGRNSGFAIAVPHNMSNSLAELEGSQRYIRLARAAIDYLDVQVAQHRIDCQWSRRGKYHCAVSARGRREILEPFARVLAALDEPYRLLDRDELQGTLGTGYFDSAIHTPGDMLVNPAALTRGLADSLPANVTLYENSPVTGFDRENGIRLETSGGSLYAPRMIMAANGFAGRFGFFAGRLLGFAAFASLTRPLTVAERTTLGGEDDWGVTPANAFAGVTMRFTQDHRILIRQHIDYFPSLAASPDVTARVRRDHERAFRARFPTLPAVTFEHSWVGYICLSKNHAPGFGRVASNVWAAVCQNGVGVTKGTVSGLLAADLACGVDNPLLADMESLGTPAPLPPRPFLDLGVIAREKWELWRNRHEA